ncbi:MAG TPA: CBS domain-containing protein [Polyangiales bacterium]
MDTYATKIREYMLSPVHTILDSQPLGDALIRLDTFGISGLGAVDRAGSLVGVISRTDLLRAGRVRLLNGKRRKVLSVPNATVQGYMTPTVEIIAPDRPMSEAAQHMLRRHVHRLYVSEDRKPAGVVSTKEMMRAVVDQRAERPISAFMHAGVVTVQAHEPVSHAVDRITATERSGVVVAEDGWPVGIFTQADALAARDAVPEDRVDEWMDPRIICLPMEIPLYRAAEQAVATRARRVLAVDAKSIRGIVTGLDFTRVVAQG